MKLFYLLFLSIFIASCSTDGTITLVPDLSGVDIAESSKTITVFEGNLDGVATEFYYDTVEPLTGYTCQTVNNVDFHIYSQADLTAPITGDDGIIDTCDPFTYSLTIITDSNLPLHGF